MKRSIILTSIIAPIIIFMFIAVVCDFQIIKDIDKAVFNCVHSLRNSIFNYIMVIITYFGEVLVIIIMAVASLFIPKNKKIVIPVLLCLAVSTLTNTILKELIHRERPPLIYFLKNPPFNLKFPTSYSFPSGHSQNGYLFYFLMGYVFITKYSSKFKNSKKVIIWIGICLVLLPFSRIYLGVHYFSDVFTGLLMGGLFIIWFLYLFNKNQDKLLV